jgi:hypothetical protein
MPFRPKRKYKKYKKERIIRKPIPEDERIPGSHRWAKSRAITQGNILKKPITRNSLTRNSKYLKGTLINSSGKDYNDEAIGKGWDYDSVTKLWSHPQYPSKSFTSILQKDGRPIPHGNDMDTKGLAYVYDTTCAGGGLYAEIKSNRWHTDEFDTRTGRRRILWEKKKEDRRKFLSHHEFEEIN